MPDFERLTRAAELHRTRNDPYQGAYVRGVHAGRDAARKEISIGVALAAFIVVVMTLMTRP